MTSSISGERMIGDEIGLFGVADKRGLSLEDGYAAIRA